MGGGLPLDEASTASSMKSNFPETGSTAGGGAAPVIASRISSLGDAQLKTIFPRNFDVNTLLPIPTGNPTAVPMSTFTSFSFFFHIPGTFPAPGSYSWADAFFPDAGLYPGTPVLDPGTPVRGRYQGTGYIPTL